VRPIGRGKKQAGQQQNIVISYNKRGKSASSDLKKVPLQDLLCWNILIKVPHYRAADMHLLDGVKGKEIKCGSKELTAEALNDLEDGFLE